MKKIFLILKAKKGSRVAGSKYFKRIPRPNGGYRYFYSKSAYDKFKKTFDEKKKKNKKYTIEDHLKPKVKTKKSVKKKKQGGKGITDEKPKRKKRIIVKKKLKTNKKKTKTNNPTKKNDYDRDKDKNLESGYIPGSKLEKYWNTVYSSIEEIENSGVANKIVTKKNLLGGFLDLDYYKNSKIEPLVAYYISGLMRKILAKPKVDNKQTRKDYYEFTDVISKALSTVKTGEELRQALTLAKEEIKTKNINLSYIGRSRNTVSSEISGLIYSTSDFNLARLRNDAYGHVDYDMVEKKYFKKRNVSKDKTKKRLYQPPKLKTSERIGFKSKKMTNSQALKSLKDLGFNKNPQYGKSLTNEDRNFHLTNTMTAFNDMIDILGIDKKDISGNSMLSLSFGARGSGRALAHYESHQKTINITNNKGNGSLAHEWFHFFDNLTKLKNDKSDDNTASGFSTHLTNDGSLSREDENWSKKLRLNKAFENLMRKIEYREKPLVVVTEKSANLSDSEFLPKFNRFKDKGVSIHWEFGIRKLEKNNYSVEKTVKEILEDENVSDRAKDRISDVVLLLENERIKRGKTTKEKVYNKYKNGYPSKSLKYNSKRIQSKTDFFEASSGQGGYWVTNHELGARAFEMYIASKLEKKGQKNTYLVADRKYMNLFKSKEDKLLYPIGEDLSHISEAFDRIFNIVGENKELLKSFLSV